ncbi:MAG: DUF6912 family protein [Nostocoides sp.]
MTQTRIYLPLTAVALSDLIALKESVAPPVPAHAVTHTLRETRSGVDEEEWEYEALIDAATSMEVRVVAAADVEPDHVIEAPGRGLTAVMLNEPVPLPRVVSFHVRQGPDDDLLWYDVTEAATVLDLVAGTA